MGIHLAVAALRQIGIDPGPIPTQLAVETDEETRPVHFRAKTRYVIRPLSPITEVSEEEQDRTQNLTSDTCDI